MFVKQAKYNKKFIEQKRKYGMESFSEGSEQGVPQNMELQPDEYFDMIPDDPINRDACAQRQELVDTYSYNRQTGTIPGDRVKLEKGVKQYKHKQYLDPKRRQEMLVYKSIKQYHQRKESQKQINFKTPIMAQKYYLREDLKNKNVIQKRTGIKKPREEIISSSEGI